MNDLQNVLIKRIVKTCSACPSQWDAWDVSGEYYYIRYRWGCLTVNKHETNGMLIYDSEVGEYLGGWMNLEEMLECTGMKLSSDCVVNNDREW